MSGSALLASTAIILLSFVSEDAASISSALSIFGGPLVWPLGFASCFTGIWIGDLALYYLARVFGRTILQNRWFARFANAETIKRCEEEFNRRGVFALVASRFIPGTRLATYLTAGLLSMPAGRFALITGLATLIWISGIFFLTSLFGSNALVWFAAARSKIASMFLIALCLGLLLFGLRKCGLIFPIIRRWRRWEFWPAWLFYLPVATYYLWLSSRHRSFTLPTAANPGIETGGFVGESKSEILKQLHQAVPDLVAEAFLIDGRTFTDRLLALHRSCRNHAIAFPFILKPDVGQRGNGVRLIHSLREAFEYLKDIEGPVVLQRYVAGPNEAGIFYFRFPDSPRGQIFSITEKIFPTISGDGTRTIEELIKTDPRASLVADTYLRRFETRKKEILCLGEILKLVESGNHAQGCIFRDGSHLWSEELEQKIDDISQRFPGFYVGRFDIRYDDEHEFRVGRSFKIVELNGSSSEATSIYDARNSLMFAYRTLFRQWQIVFQIGSANRSRGITPSGVLHLWREWRRYSRLALSYPCAS